MKLSVSLSEKDVEFLDYYVKEHELESRSAGLQAALRALLDVELEPHYEAAFQEQEDPEWLAHWHKVWLEAGGPERRKANAAR